MLVLYSRPRCHLCHDAARMLAEAGIPFEERDITGDAELEAEYGWEVPVLVDETGLVLLKGVFSPAAIAKLRTP